MTTSEQGLKVLGTNWSPFVARVRISLSLKAIHYAYLEEKEDFLQNKSQLLLQCNPVHQKVPVLIHNGKPISESLVIVHYIEETWPSSPHPLLPCDPYDRALACFWAAFVDDKLFPSLKKICITAGKEARAQWVEEARANMAILEEALKTVGKGKTYFGGECIGFVDVVFGSYYGNIKTSETIAEVSLINEQATPALSALLQALKGNEKLKDLLPDPVVLADLYRKKYHS